MSGKETCQSTWIRLPFETSLNSSLCKKKFEDTKGVNIIRNNKSKDRQYNDEKEKIKGLHGLHNSRVSSSSSS